MIKLAREKRETTITFLDCDNFADVYSCVPRHLKKLQELAKKYPNDVKLVEQDNFGETYRLPEKWVINFKKPVNTWDSLTDEQKEKRKAIAKENLKRS